MAAAKKKAASKPLDEMSLATWARLKAAGKIAKPNGAERMDQNPGTAKRGKKKK